MVLHEQLEHVRPAGGGGRRNAVAAASYKEWMREVSANRFDETDRPGGGAAATLV